VAKPKPVAGAAEAEVAKASADNTVFVDGVPYIWNEKKVEEFFQECGPIVRVSAPTWQDSGRLRGFAHVTFKEAAGRKKALQLNGTMVGKNKRYLKIEQAKAPDTEAAAPTVDLEGKRRLFVKNLPYDAAEDEIATLFKKCGRVVEVRVPTSFGRSKGFAYVEFQSTKGLKAAVELRPPPELRGRTLRLDADGGAGPKAGFHHRPEAYDSKFGKPKGDAKGKGKAGGGKGNGKAAGKLSLF